MALFVDGKSLQQDQIVIVLGITMDGQKIPLGFVQTHSENGRSLSQLLEQLIARGLDYSQGLLGLVDGSKGLLKGLKDTFGNKILIQRCQWHKRENVISYLNKTDQDHYRKRLNQAYQKDSYEEAKSELVTIGRELRGKNLSAFHSLEEGLEETLTLHRLGLVHLFRKNFTTTNCIENLNSQLRKYIGKVKRWHNSEQRYRWIASGLLEIEFRMRRVENHKKLYLLRQGIQEILGIKLNHQREHAACASP